MKPVFVLLILVSCNALGFDLTLSNHTRVVFLGDSITDAKRWSHYLSTYLVLLNPALTLHLQTEGRGGSNLREVYEQPTGTRYDRRVHSYQSQALNMVVFLMFGRNNSGTTNQFWTDLSYVATNRVAGSNSALPVLVAPHPENEPDGGGSTFAGYEDQVINLGTEQGWPYAGIWRGLTNIWENNTIDGVDETHPGAGGHAMIAYEIIKLLALETNVSSATLNGSSPSITATNHCYISSLSAIANGISFTRLDDRLPWTFDEAGRTLAETLMPEMVGWQSYTITVTGLASGTYDISIDGSLVATATHTALAAGLNMSTWNQGPIYNQCQEVLGRIRDMHGINRTTLANLPAPNKGVVRYKSNADNGYNNLGYRGQDLIDYLQGALTEIAGYDDLIHTAAQPVARTFTIVKQGGVQLVGRTGRGVLQSR